MALTNAQYDRIMRIYDMRQSANRDTLSKRRRQVYLAAPELSDIDRQVASLSIEEAMKEGAADDALYRSKVTALHEARGAVLAGLGYPEDYLDPIYDCPDCKDTGYIGQEKCHCFRQLSIDTLYENSNLDSLIEDGDFSNFSLELYDKEYIDPVTGLNSFEAAKRSLDSCRGFVQKFPKGNENLYIYGNVGLGKTLLTHCIAKELLSRGYSVLYYTASEFFDALSSHTFGRDDDDPEKYSQIYGCDLLIVDDLGTELTNRFVISGLFECINGRALAKRATVFSTNLSLEDTESRYGDRVFSRLISSYQMLHLFGNDIRLKLKMDSIV